MTELLIFYHKIFDEFFCGIVELLSLESANTSCVILFLIKTFNSSLNIIACSFHQEYEDNAVDVNYESVHGNTLVSELASELQGIMEKKTEALRVSNSFNCLKMWDKFMYICDVPYQSQSYVAKYRK